MRCFLPHSTQLECRPPKRPLSTRLSALFLIGSAIAGRAERSLISSPIASAGLAFPSDLMGLVGRGASTFAPAFKRPPRRYLRRRAANWFKVSTPTENPIAA